MFKKVPTLHTPARVDIHIQKACNIAYTLVTQHAGPFMACSIAGELVTTATVHAISIRTDHTFIHPGGVSARHTFLHPVGFSPPHAIVHLVGVSVGHSPNSAMQADTPPNTNGRQSPITLHTFCNKIKQRA